MGDDYRKKSIECFDRADYDGHVRYAKLQHQRTQSKEDQKSYERALENRELYKEMQEIINSDQEDYYGILGVNEKTPVTEINKSFRKLAFKYHPNKTGVEGATEAMRIIQKAYFEINTEEKKAAYDRKREISSFSGFSGRMQTPGTSSIEEEILRRFGGVRGFRTQMSGHPIYTSQIFNDIFENPYSNGDIYRHFYNNTVYRRNNRNSTRSSSLWELGTACLIQLLILYAAISCFF
ncbi:DnaJ-like protein subfamily B member 12 [Pancytospora epiphaga]|nr:DnaJ-like protein subfamily B member 12 [Pancytospora epiphaga]